VEKYIFLYKKKLDHGRRLPLGFIIRRRCSSIVKGKLLIVLDYYNFVLKIYGDVIGVVSQ
jgi:hypothetical protein